MLEIPDDVCREFGKFAFGQENDPEQKGIDVIQCFINNGFIEECDAQNLEGL